MLMSQKNPHGGDIYTNASVNMDFSANLNCAGMPEKVKSALIKAAENCSSYPDPYCRELRRRISQYERVDMEQILCGNGAAELIYQYACTLPKGKPALILSPTFCEYEKALSSAGISSEHYLLTKKNGFRLTSDILSADLTKYCAVFLCSPNNPTGITVEADIIYAMASGGVWLFCDFSFLNMTDKPDKYDIPFMLKAYPNITVLRAFTKDFAMAGVRLGYALCSDTDFLEQMSDKVQCWNVSTFAQCAGIAALDCCEWLRNSVKYITVERQRMICALREFNLKVYPGEANYLLLYSERDLYKQLLKRGILVRDCSNYIGLCNGYIRIAVRTREENNLLISKIGEILK